MILAIYSLSFFIRNLSGPFNILGIIRNKLVRNSLVGFLFFKLLDCSWCIGFHCGYIIYIISFWKFNFNLLILWALAGSSIVAVLDVFFDYVNQFKR